MYRSIENQRLTSRPCPACKHTAGRKRCANHRGVSLCLGSLAGWFVVLGLLPVGKKILTNRRFWG